MVEQFIISLLLSAAILSNTNSPTIDNYLSSLHEETYCAIAGFETEEMYSTAHLNIRFEPTTDSNILCTVNVGDKLEIIDYQAEKEWNQVFYNNGVYYVCTQYISKEMPNLIDYYSIHGYIPDYSYQEYAWECCKEYGIEYYYPILLCQIYQESHWNPNCVGGGSSIGFMQIKNCYKDAIRNIVGMYDGNLFDGYYNIRLGTAYMAHLLNHFNGDIRCALSSYFNGNYTVGGSYPDQVLQHLKEERKIIYE